MDRPTPAEKVNAASIDVDEQHNTRTRATATRAQYSFPRRSIDDALRIPAALRANNGGEPFPPGEIARSLNVGGRTGNFFYLTTASRDYGFTEGSRDASVISLTKLGRQAVYPSSDEDAYSAKMTAFLNVDKFKGVVEHYKGSKLPGDEFVRNVLETKFGLDPKTHDEFLDVFQRNCRLLGIGADWTPDDRRTPRPELRRIDESSDSDRVQPSVPTKGALDDIARPQPICFVAMPFSEKSDEYAPGFFDEVYSSLFEPALSAAGFEARTARGQGSDIIHSTIVNGLLDADLVLVDLTEHNPNVLFELGLRIAEKKPIVLVKAIGTNPIFDVDNLMRVASYNPNLWLSTVVEDVKRLTDFIRGAWSARDTERPFMDILRQH